MNVWLITVNYLVFVYLPSPRDNLVIVENRPNIFGSLVGVLVYVKVEDMQYMC